MKMLVTGATRKLGTKVVESLLKNILASRLAVSVRNQEKGGRITSLWSSGSPRRLELFIRYMCGWRQ